MADFLPFLGCLFIWSLWCQSTHHKIIWNSQQAFNVCLCKTGMGIRAKELNWILKFSKKTSFFVTKLKASCEVCQSINYSWAREVLLKGKAKYSWPPCTNQFRSAPYYFENIIYLWYKMSGGLNEEVNCTELSRSVSIPWLSTNDTQVQIKSNISFFWQISFIKLSSENNILGKIVQN